MHVARSAARLFLLCVVSPAALLAQSGAVTGSVRLAGSGGPVTGAAVVVLGTRLGAHTDAAGAFRIDSVPAGVYELEARYPGMSPSRSAVTVRAGTRAAAALLLADAPAELGGVTVVGRRADALARVPGSASVIDERMLAAQNPVSANEALRTIPGVHIQDEEGAGLRANIGIRGLDPDRSRTVLVLEDGVPVALAPYGEPEMYYSPPVDRMERIEVIKGSGSIVYGPQTVGGVINYVTAAPPAGRQGRLQLQGGTGDMRLVKLGYGGTWGRARGSATAFQKKADDWNGLFFDVRDFTTKLGARTGAGDFGVKVSLYEEESNATYVGLTDSLFRSSPDVHPQPADRLDISRYAITGTHELGLGRATTLRTSAYAYETTRNWNRRDYTYTSSGSNYVFRNTTGSRDRSFDVAGVEPRLTTAWTVAGRRNDLDVGLRAHYERAGDRHVNGAVDSDAKVVRDDEVRTGRALAAFVQNRVWLTPALYVTPGLRLERFEFDRNILRTRVARRSGSTVTRNPEDVDIRTEDVVGELIPGIGAAWTPSELATVFAGAHRGFAPPRVKDALILPDSVLDPNAQVPDVVSLQLDAEHSWNYEVGARLTPASYLSLEATAFYLDFSNQIIEPSLSAGSVAQASLANQGATRHAGVEAAARLDVGKLLRHAYSLVLDVGHTYSSATFSKDRYMRLGSGDTVNVKGNRLPYAPRHTTHAGLAFTHPGGLTLRLDGTFVGEQYADNFETVAVSPNGRTGLIPARHVFDAAAHVPVPGIRGLRVVGSVKNLADETYVASRRPEGIKPGLPRIAAIGLTWEF